MDVKVNITIDFFYVHGTVHLSNNSFIEIPTRCNLFYLFGLFFTTLHISDAVAATTVCKQITPEDGHGLRPKHVEL